jgi:hypothetical protein
MIPRFVFSGVFLMCALISMGQGKVQPAKEEKEPPVAGFCYPYPQPLNLDELDKIIRLPKDPVKVQSMDTELNLILHFSDSGYVDEYYILDHADPILEAPITNNLHLLHFTSDKPNQKSYKCWADLHLVIASGHLIQFVETLENADTLVDISDHDATAYDWGEPETSPAEEEEHEPLITEYFGGTEPVPLNLDSVTKVIGYPAGAKEDEIQGKVVVRLLLDKQGNAVKYILLRDPHPILTKAVTDNVLSLKFTPGYDKGKPVMCWVTLPFLFAMAR